MACYVTGSVLVQSTRSSNVPSSLVSKQSVYCVKQGSRKPFPALLAPIFPSYVTFLPRTRGPLHSGDPGLCPQGPPHCYTTSSIPGRASLCNDLGQVIHARVSLSPSSIIWWGVYWPRTVMPRGWEGITTVHGPGGK